MPLRSGLLAAVLCVFSVVAQPKWLQQKNPEACKSRCQESSPLSGVLLPSELQPLRCIGYRVLVIAIDCPQDVNKLRTCHDTHLQRQLYAGGGNTTTNEGDFYWPGNWNTSVNGPANDLEFGGLCISLTGECSTNSASRNCQGKAVYQKVQEPPDDQLGCNNGRLIALPNYACPKQANYNLLVTRGCDSVPFGHLCFADGHCSTYPDLSNCGYYPGVSTRGDAFDKNVVIGLPGDSIYEKVSGSGGSGGSETPPSIPVRPVITPDAPQMTSCSNTGKYPQFSSLAACQRAMTALKPFFNHSGAFGGSPAKVPVCLSYGSTDIRMASSKHCPRVVSVLNEVIGNEIQYATNPSLSTAVGFVCHIMVGGHDLLGSAIWSWDRDGDCAHVRSRFNTFLQTLSYPPVPGKVPVPAAPAGGANKHGNMEFLVLMVGIVICCAVAQVLWSRCYGGPVAGRHEVEMGASLSQDLTGCISTKSTQP